MSEKREEINDFLDRDVSVSKVLIGVSMFFGLVLLIGMSIMFPFVPDITEESENPLIEDPAEADNSDIDYYTVGISSSIVLQDADEDFDGVYTIEIETSSGLTRKATVDDGSDEFTEIEVREGDRLTVSYDIEEHRNYSQSFIVTSGGTVDIEVPTEERDIENEDGILEVGIEGDEEVDLFGDVQISVDEEVVIDEELRINELHEYEVSGEKGDIVIVELQYNNRVIVEELLIEAIDDERVTLIR